MWSIFISEKVTSVSEAAAELRHHDSTVAKNEDLLLCEPTRSASSRSRGHQVGHQNRGKGQDASLETLRTVSHWRADELLALTPIPASFKSTCFLFFICTASACQKVWRSYRKQQHRLPFENVWSKGHKSDVRLFASQQCSSVWFCKSCHVSKSSLRVFCRSTRGKSQLTPVFTFCTWVAEWIHVWKKKTKTTIWPKQKYLKVLFEVKVRTTVSKMYLGKTLKCWEGWWGGRNVKFVTK